MRRSQQIRRGEEPPQSTIPGDIEAAPQIADTLGVETSAQRRRRLDLDRQGIDHEDMAQETDEDARESSDHSM